MDSMSPLQDWLRAQLAAGLPALTGARVSGRVPVQVDLLNPLIAGALADATRQGGAPAPRASPTAPVDLAGLLKHVRQLQIDAAPGTVTVNFELAIDA